MEQPSALIVEDESEFLRSSCETVGREPGFSLLGAVTSLGAADALLAGVTICPTVSTYRQTPPTGVGRVACAAARNASEPRWKFPPVL